MDTLVRVVVIFDVLVFSVEDDAKHVSEAVERGSGHYEGDGGLAWSWDGGDGVGRGDFDVEMLARL